MSDPGAPTSERGRRASRDDRWDRTPWWRSWRSWVGGLGRILVALGVLLLGFVGYQLWGTGVQEARAQESLEAEFEAALAALPVVSVAPPTSAPARTTVPPSTVVPTAPAPTTTLPPVELPVLVPGGAVARIEIPRIGVDKFVVAGTAKADLTKGPGHYAQTPFPGEVGNVAIAGHRTTYGAPFFRVDELQPGDEIVLTSFLGRYVYRVTQQLIVAPSDTWVVGPSDQPELTLTSCHPRYSARQRIVVKAALDESLTPAYRGDVSGGYPSLVPPPVVLPDESTVAPEPTTAPVATAPVATAPVATAPVATAPVDAGGAGGVTTARPPTTVSTAATTAISTVTSTVTGTVTAEDLTGVGLEEGFEQGWGSDTSAWWDVLWWGLACASVAVGAWLLGRRTKQWVVGPLAVLPFLACLWFFYGAVTRLLPPGY